ncbi:MAG: MBL fold metallo-hydrolase [Gammaproteobacteria bacterium]|nr:MBL fold metallo-hydrolase [Gammaproteobacteria bacterium]MYC98773.1 MBL fold metallo-hydrolase [Gammaproteobacteria bacterium]MYF62738.1 MBL fold metallo-hydrolase [Gammaproteobacteria bacterium]MYI23073.1 MBL fold metallo-hydrolase [Gammaproteobacteria bacterium]
MLGTGTPIADPDRFGPSVAVVVGEESYLVDAGAGVVRRAAAAARNGIAALAPSNLKRVFITHLHSDHTVGLPDLMFTPWQNGRNMPVEVYGPPGTLRMTTNIEEAWVEDVHMRLFGLEGRTAHNYRALTREIEAGTVYDDGTVRVDAIPVQHTSWPVSFGYRFVTPDRTIVISGDARPSPSLVEACNGCDVLVHEVYSRDFFDRHRNQIYHAAAHTSTAEVAALAMETRPGLLVLYHQLYRSATDEDLIREVREAGYTGRVVSAADLDVY